MRKICLHTLAYNAESTINRCVDSIINQTYKGRVDWYILDNGSTDNTLHMLTEYEQEYKFIHISHIDKNCSPQNEMEHNIWNQFSKRVNLDMDGDDYYCMIDSDDQYKPDFFEKMVSFMEKYNLDIGVAGNDFIDANTNELLGIRRINQNLILESSASFKKYFPIYHGHMRTVWGKLFKGYVIQNFYRNKNLVYGNDTWFVFHTLRRASRVGIMNESLYKYYVSLKSTSYEYNPQRFDSDVILYEDALDFLSLHGTISQENRTFLKIVYSNALVDTARVINKSALPAEEKLCEYNKILSHAITKTIYQEENKTLDVIRNQNYFCHQVLEISAQLSKKKDKILCAVINKLIPRCGKIVRSRNVRLFLEDQQLLQDLIEDNPRNVLQRLLRYVADNHYIKKYGLIQMIQILATDNLLLCQIDNTVFFQAYGQIYLTIWDNEPWIALEEMTGMLLENRVKRAKETFLKLYISLAAALAQEEAFVFGKIKLMELYQRQNRKNECLVLLEELEEMGFSEHPEYQEVKRWLDART